MSLLAWCRFPSWRWVVLSMHYYHSILLRGTHCFRCVPSRSTKHHWTLDTPCQSEERRAQSSYKLHLNAFKVKKAPFSFWKPYFGGHEWDTSPAIQTQGGEKDVVFNQARGHLRYLFLRRMRNNNEEGSAEKTTGHTALNNRLPLCVNSAFP